MLSHTHKHIFIISLALHLCKKQLFLLTWVHTSEIAVVWMRLCVFKISSSHEQLLAHKSNQMFCFCRYLYQIRNFVWIILECVRVGFKCWFYIYFCLNCCVFLFIFWNYIRWILCSYCASFASLSLFIVKLNLSARYCCYISCFNYYDYRFYINISIFTVTRLLFYFARFNSDITIAILSLFYFKSKFGTI
jgi:hypothetical protein